MVLQNIFEEPGGRKGAQLCSGPVWKQRTNGVCKKRNNTQGGGNVSLTNRVQSDTHERDGS